MFKLNIPSPIHKLDTINNINLFVKREDLIHPSFGGNKWRKLKYNLQEFKTKKFENLITFGGAFSNHIAATASICQLHKIPSVGLIRGTYEDKNNPTLNLAIKNGMRIHHIPKSEYKLKNESIVVKSIINQYKNPFIVPEGGSNELAIKGIVEMVNEVQSKKHFNHIIVAAGTGKTATGIIQAADSKTMIWVINVLRNESLEPTIARHVKDKKNWTVLSDYDFGGYAKVPKNLKEFSNKFYEKYNLLLDPIYTSKMMFAALDLIQKNKYNKGDNILTIHTGGLQGIDGFEYISKSKWIN